MGRMKELHMELVNQGLSDKEIENYDFDMLDFDNHNAPNGEQWYTHEDENGYAEELESIRIQAEIIDWRLFGAM